MASKSSKAKKPTHEAFVVTGEGDNAFWTKLGACWPHEEKKEKSTGGPEYHLAVLGQLGRTFTQLVFQGYHDHYFTLRDVAGLLNMKVTTVPVMEKAAFGLAG